MTDEEKIAELRKMLMYFIDLYFGAKWRDVKKEDGYITFHKLDEARKLLIATQ